MKQLVTLLSILSLAPASFGFFSLMDTGDLVKKDDYRILGEGQILFDAPKGFNLNGRFSTGLDDESEVQFEAGVGSVDFYLGAFYKWIPFPDTDEQPAIGVRGGLTFASIDYDLVPNDDAYSTYGINVTPMVSKGFESGAGKFTPYGGAMFGLQKNVNDTNFSMQIVAGCEWSPNEWDFRSLKDFNFLIEYGIEVDDAFSYLSLGSSYDF